MDHGLKLRAPDRRGARHAAIKRLLRARAVATQDELVKLLDAEGFHVTQATLSRDLAQLRAVRLPGRSGGAVYDLEAQVPGEEAPAELRELVVSVHDNEALCVVRTRVGAAPAVARAIDVTRMPDVLGTLAGDDTIFVTPIRGTPTRRLTAALRALFGL